MAQSSAAQVVEKYYKELKCDAEDLIHKIPERIMFLKKQLENQIFLINETDVSKFDFNVPVEVLRKKNKQLLEAKTISSITNANKAKTMNSTAINPDCEIIKKMEIVKLNLLQVIEDAGSLKVWLKLLSTKAEDGNNFGVSVQDSFIQEFDIVEKNMKSYSTTFSMFYEIRGKMLTNIQKFPYIEDFHQALEYHDELHNMRMAQAMHEIRNFYSYFYDAVIKNIKNLKTPKPEGMGEFYSG